MRAKRHEVASRSSPSSMNAPGLAGVTIETASGAAVSLDRAPGGLRGVRRARDGTERVVDGAGRLARRGRHPRRGRPPGAAARPDLRAGARRARVMVVMRPVSDARDPAASSRTPRRRSRSCWSRRLRRAAHIALVGRLDAAARLRAGGRARRRTGAARRCGSATSAACRRTTSAPTTRMADAGAARPPARGPARRASMRMRGRARRRTRRRRLRGARCASSSATTRGWTSRCSASGPDGAHGVAVPRQAGGARRPRGWSSASRRPGWSRRSRASR